MHLVHPRLSLEGKENQAFNPPPAVPRSIAGCGARKYRGELRSVATRRGIKKTSNGSNRGGLEYKQAPDNCGGASGFVPLAIEKNKQDRKYNHAIIPLSPYPTFAKKQTSDDRYKIRNDHRPER